jgi:fibronectin type 3 domain-containing protein/anti-sigma regulatory factor (Ser/Thr protein kinase)
VQVDNGGAEDPVEVTVTLDNSSPATAFVFKRKPWGSKTIVNMPPCVEAGPDQTITLLEPATMSGSATDDGDPNPPGSITVTWSKVGGPGEVTFGNAHALVTTASFNAPGTYVLRLTADDGQLQGSDETAIVVESVNPVLSINDVTLNEGNTGAVEALFTVSLAASNGQEVTVEYEASDGTATGGSDYVAGSGTLTFPAGITTQTISVPVNGDLIDEPDETFFINLKNPANADISDNQAQGTIIDDDTAPPVISSFSPSSGPAGSVVSINGSYLTGATQVTLGGVAASNFTVVSSSEIHTEVPAGAPLGQGKISVTTLGGTANSSEDFTVTPPLPPVIDSFNPPSGPVGTQVTITGAYFTGATEVAFNGVPAPNFTIVSTAQIRATVPNDATTGKITVTAPGGTTTSSNDFTVTTSLIGYWKFDEGNGTQAADASGNGNNGTVVDATWTTGKVGGALRFDGVNNYVGLGNGASLNVTGLITLAAWVKPENISGLRNIISHGYTLSPNGEVILRMNSGKYEIGTWDGAGHGTTFPIPTGDLNTWVHLAGTYDGVAWRLYRNGVQVNATNDATGAVTVNANWAIGARGTGTERFFQGCIDEARIYNRALSSGEIAQLAQLDNTPPTAPGGLSATANGENINLSWTAASDAESGITAYKIYRGATTGSETFFTQLGNVTNYFDQTTAPNAAYYYQVSAVNGAGLEGSRSNEVSATTGNNPPAAPTGLTASAGNQQITLDWADNSEPDLAAYHVYRATTAGGPYTRISTSLLTSSSYTDAGLTNGTPYFYVVKAVDVGGNESGNSNEASATPIDRDVTVVGYWKFDEGDGTSTMDASGTGNNGTVSGATWTTGKAGGALRFDGVNDYVGVGNGASLNFAGRITIAAWIKPEATDGLRNIVVHGYSTSPNGEVILRINAGKYEIGSWDGTVHGTVSTIPTGDVNNWVHLAGLYDGTTWRLYRNGVQVNSRNDATGAVTVNANWAIGARGTGTGRFFQGSIDDVYIYNRALSVAEIAQLAQLDNTPPTAPGGLNATASGEQVNLSWTAASDAESGISGYKIYRGTTTGGETFLTQGGSVTSYTDQATSPNTTYFYQVSAVNGSGLEGSRSNEGSALTGDNPPAPPSGLTASAENQKVALDWADHSAPDLAGYHVYRATTAVGPYIQITTSLLSSSAYTDGGLTNGTMYYYVVRAKDTAGNESGNSNEANAIPIDRDVTLVGYWKFDEGSGTSAADASGNGNNGVVVNGATWTAGRVNGALRFDGVNDYANMGNGASLNFSGRITIAAWVKPEATSGLRNIVSHGYTLSPNAEVILRINASKYEVGSWNGTGFGATASIPAGDVNNWVHLVGVYDGAAWRLYRNGAQVSSSNATTGAVTVNGNWAIGSRGTGTERFFQGCIDDVRIYSRNLSVSEIQALANGTLSKDSNGDSETDSPEISLPQRFYLAQNYPNPFGRSPFNPATVIRYELPEPVHVKLVVYDIVGRKIRTLVDAVEPAGFRQIVWDGANETGARVASGTYLIQIHAGSYKMTRKLQMMK